MWCLFQTTAFKGNGTSYIAQPMPTRVQITHRVLAGQMRDCEALTFARIWVYDFPGQSENATRISAIIHLDAQNRVIDLRPKIPRVPKPMLHVPLSSESDAI